MLIIDGHCDTLTKLSKKDILCNNNISHLDLQRVKNNINLQFMAVFTPPETQNKLNLALSNIEKLLQIIEENPNQVYLIKHQHDLNILDSLDKKIANILLSIEGADILEGNLDLLPLLYRLGVRSIGLTWNNNNAAADGCMDGNRGLSFFGEALVKQMEKLGMIIDLAHIAPKGFEHTLAIAKKPLLVSHTACAAIHTPEMPKNRNLTDKQWQMLAKNNGVGGITFVADFLAAKDASIKDLLTHIDHAVKIAGIDHVAIGSDFDGTDKLPKNINGIEFLSKLPNILANHGYSKEHIDKIMGLNMQRILKTIL